MKEKTDLYIAQNGTLMAAWYIYKILDVYASEILAPKKPKLIDFPCYSELLPLPISTVVLLQQFVGLFLFCAKLMSNEYIFRITENILTFQPYAS
jgi:hypothetical protein